MANAEQLKFVDEIAPIIQREAFARGYKFPSAIIAQAIHESAWGMSGLSAGYHNYFGLKCGSSWKGASVNMKTKEEYTSGLVTIRDNFRVYADMEAGVVGYFDFIKMSRYSNLKNATSSLDYLQKIKADGYATGSNYAENCYKYVTTYNLIRFDNNIEYFPQLVDSIIMGLKAVDAEYSWEYRGKIARANGIENYKGSAEQNNRMLLLLKQCRLIKPQ